MRVSVLEDDPDMRALMVEWLTQAGYVVYEFGTARDFMRLLARESFDLCLLDGNLPDIQGRDVLHWMRNDRRDLSPVMFVTARDAEEDIVSALHGGADDYVVKPVRHAELLARMEAILRRTQPALGGEAYVEGPYSFDLKRKCVVVDGVVTELTDKEFDLALFMFRNLGRLVSRGHLLEAVWGRNPSVATRTVDTHVSRVRSKLQLRPEMGYRLTPTYNYGYRLERTEALART
ncbi:MAG TPA: response regulator transcription factor [Rhodocyclaceae bacterium]|nr:response regulator transcription factor [Zoogloeaceae bacterium]HRD34455.1 response regulator transcription factor [Rhodocyclaceae bacterium]